jgi:hypothetical protein
MDPQHWIFPYLVLASYAPSSPLLKPSSPVQLLLNPVLTPIPSCSLPAQLTLLSQSSSLFPTLVLLYSMIPCSLEHTCSLLTSPILIVYDVPYSSPYVLLLRALRQPSGQHMAPPHALPLRSPASSSSSPSCLTQSYCYRHPAPARFPAP